MELPGPYIKVALLQRNTGAQSVRLAQPFEHRHRASPVGRQRWASSRSIRATRSALAAGVATRVKRPGRRAHGDQRQEFAVGQAGERFADTRRAPPAQCRPPRGHRAAKIGGREERLQRALLVDLGIEGEAGQDDQLALAESRAGNARRRCACRAIGKPSSCPRPEVAKSRPLLVQKVGSSTASRIAVRLGVRVQLGGIGGGDDRIDPGRDAAIARARPASRGRAA